MKTEKITFTLDCLWRSLLSILLAVALVCLIKITNTYCAPADSEKEYLEKDLIRMQIRSFEWDENHRDYLYR